MSRDDLRRAEEEARKSIDRWSDAKKRDAKRLVKAINSDSQSRRAASRSRAQDAKT